MRPEQRQNSRRRVPARKRPAPATNTLGSIQLPSFALEPSLERRISSGRTLRVPSPTESDEEAIQAAEARSTKVDFPKHLTTHPIDFSFSESNADSLSKLGNSSSLFSEASAIDLTTPAQSNSPQPFQFGSTGSTTNRISLFHSLKPANMVVEREPPKATPQKPAQPPAFTNVTQPQFGQPSILQNRLQPSNVFNIPKPHQTRPEHHRPPPPPGSSHLQQVKDFAQKAVDPVRSHYPIQPRPSQAEPDVLEIPKPANAPIWNTSYRAPPSYSSFNPPGGFAAVNAYQRPVVDLTKPHLPYQESALFNNPFGPPDPYSYIDAAKANENIKELLEGAFDDEEDKPRTRGRKKKVENAIADLSDKLGGLDVKADSDKENHEEEDHEDEDEDDGVVEGLKVKLLPHQVDGVEWMRDKEIGVKKKKNGILPKGGILADDMGLGKTIQSIALLLTNPRPALLAATSVTDKKALSPNVGKGTLVVAPLALIKQWEGEIRNRVTESHRLHVCVHHGPQRTKRFEDLKKYDVVITTYQILVSEHGSSSMRDDGPKVGCLGIHWYRVILDEAHTIKNRNAKATQACYALRTEYRWCLTGTPMQNNLDELQSLIKFLRIKPYNDLAVWREQITQPISRGQGDIAIKRLQFYLKAFMKRRTKDVLKQEGALNPGGKPSKDGQINGFKITARNVESIHAQFSDEERRFYDRLEKRAGKSLDDMIEGEKMNYASALVLLLRLRQACNHPQLVGNSMGKDLDALSTGQGSGAYTKKISGAAVDDVDAMADLLGGMSMQIKQCDVCQIALTLDEASTGSIRCTECEEDLALETLRKEKHKNRNQKKHRSSTKAESEKSKLRAAKHRRTILDDSDEEDENADWVVPKKDRHAANLGKAGGSEDENAEGGGESLASEDTDTEDESSINIAKSRPREVISLDTSDEEAEEDEKYPKEVSEEEEEEEEVSSSEPDSSLGSITTSAKIQQLLRILHRESSTHKFIVFSQFTSMLDLIEPFLKRSNLIFTRYDGSMRNDHREASLTRLRTNPQTRILLCSLKCGSLGLNLTAASRVVILEPFWNPFVEEQAIDRVHRLNQTQDVTVYKLTVANTVEARILDLQEKKRALAKAAIGGGGENAAGKLSMKDILKLFNRDAEHARTTHAHEVNTADLAAKTRVLSPPPITSKSGFSNVLNEKPEGQSMRSIPPIMAKGKPAVKEDAVYGRRW